MSTLEPPMEPGVHAPAHSPDVPASATAVDFGQEEPPSPDAKLIDELRSRVESLEKQDRQERAEISRMRVSVTTRSVVEILALIGGTVALVYFVTVAWGSITFVLISLLIALALNPAVEFFACRGLPRGVAAGVVALLAVLALGVLGLVLIPPLVDQVTKFIHSLPSQLNQLSKGHGPLGFLERKFHVVQEANKLIKTGGSSAGKVAGPGLGIISSVVGTVIGLVVIAFMTLFMLLEGPAWVERIVGLLPEGLQPRFRRVGSGISKTVGGFITGNLVASVLGGAITGVVLFLAGLPDPIPLGVLVAFLDLLPIFGALIAIVLIAVISFAHGVGDGVIVTGVLFIYHQIEVYYLRPLIYGSMIQLSPLAVLVAATIGTEVAGPLGAVAAIPAGGAVQLVLTEILDARREGREARAGGEQRPADEQNGAS